MSRKPRVLSNSGIYHLIARGIDKAMIFIEDDDCYYFLSCLSEVAGDEGVEIHSYCLMGNHFHLLVKTNRQESPARFMKRLEIKYAMYFNRKYERVGALFQGRYKSECVEDDDYYLTVFRYILRNPVKAHIADSAFDYEWSSAKELISSNRGLTAFDDVLAIIEKDDLIRFIEEDQADECADVDNATSYVSDRVAKEVFQAEFGNHVLLDVRNYDIKTQRKVFGLLTDNHCSGRQISRLTGVPRGLIRRLLTA